MTASNTLLAAVTLVAGWLSLLPVRRRIGAAAYHAAAFPAGMLAWVGAAAATTLAGVPFRSPVAPAGAALAVAACAAFLRAVAGSEPAGTWNRASLWLFPAQGAVFVGVAAVVARLGFHFASWDSYLSYEATASDLFDRGAPSPMLMGTRSILIPAMHAGNRLLGGSWTYAVYPLVAMSVLSLLAYALWSDAFAGCAPRQRAFLTAAVTVALAATPVFVYQTFYVHSHMTSAAYLLLALVGVMRAVSTGTSSGDARAWLAVSGIAVGGLALARPDGPAYAAMVLVVAAVLALRRDDLRGAVGLLAAPLLGVLALGYIPAFVSLGLWKERKLSGLKAAQVLAALAALALTPLVLRRSRRFVAFIASARHVAITAALVDVAALAAVTVARGSQARTVARIMAFNLLRYGGYHWLWYLLFGAIVLSLIVPALWRDSPALGPVLFVFTQFFVAALIVQILARTGHYGYSDSFSRIAFHAVPVGFLYVGSIAGSIARGLAAAPSISEESMAA